MKIKLISFVIALICLSCVVVAGLLSVHRSEGRVISPEAQAQIGTFLNEHGIELPTFIAEQIPDQIAD